MEPFTGMMSATTSTPFGTASTIAFGGMPCVCVTVATACRTLVEPLAASTIGVWDDVQQLPAVCAPGEWQGTAADLYTQRLTQTAAVASAVQELAHEAALLSLGTEVA